MLTDARGEVVAAVRADSAGRYRVAGVSSGAHTLVVSAEGARPAALTVTMPETGVLTQDIELVSALILSGTVRNGDGRPVPDARIVIQDGDARVVATTHTDDDGQYIVADLPEGEYTVVASGYPPSASRVVLGSGPAAEHDVTLGY
jgi:hypothetical protein